jgi:hypothetical protein
MYRFFNRHFGLGLSEEAMAERDYVPLLPSEATVWAGDFSPGR